MYTMNKFPIVDMIALYSVRRIETITWSPDHTYHIEKVRSCHSRTDGGVVKSFYSVETRRGEILDLVYNEEELTWSLEGREIEKILVQIHRHKHMHSRAHRIVPIRLELRKMRETNEPGLPLTWRVQPYRFQTGKILSSQVIEIRTRHLENVMITKHLHYVVRTDQNRYFHLVFIQDEQDWRFMQEVDEELFFATHFGRGV